MSVGRRGFAARRGALRRRRWLVGRPGCAGPLLRGGTRAVTRARSRSTGARAGTRHRVRPSAGSGGRGRRPVGPGSRPALGGTRGRRGPRPGRGAAVLLCPARALEMDRRRREGLAHRPRATHRTGLRTVGDDGVEDLESVAVRAEVVVGRHRGRRAAWWISRGAGACRTSGSRTPARGRMQTRSGRTRGRPDRRRERADRQPSVRARTGWRGRW